MLWSHQRSVLSRTEECAVVPSGECCVANREECCGPTRGVLCREQRSGVPCLLPTEETAVLRTDNVAAPNRNLADLAENRSVFDENWGVLDENSAPAGLAAWPAFRPNIIPK